MKVILHEVKRVFDGFLKVNQATLSHERFDGGMLGPIRRLNVERGDAVAALLEDRQTGELIFVKQFRYPAYTKGHGWLLEVIAGTCEPDALPEQEIRREIREEAGFEVGELTLVATFFTTPGGSSERIILYHALVSPTQQVEAGGGLADEGEDILLVRLPLRTAYELVRSGQIQDSKAIIAIQWRMLQGG